MELHASQVQCKAVHCRAGYFSAEEYLLCSTEQNSAEWQNVVLCRAVDCNTGQGSAVQWIATQGRAGQCSAVQCRAV